MGMAEGWREGKGFQVAKSGAVTGCRLGACGETTSGGWVMGEPAGSEGSGARATERRGLAWKPYGDSKDFLPRKCLFVYLFKRLPPVGEGRLVIGN
jgi:hypothetical protein